MLTMVHEGLVLEDFGSLFQPGGRHLPCRWREPQTTNHKPQTTNHTSHKAGGRHKFAVASGFVSLSGLDVSHSFRWLTPSAVDASASGLSLGFPHGMKIAQINSLCKISFSNSLGQA